jgi:hypothetical protein
MRLSVAAFLFDVCCLAIQDGNIKRWERFPDARGMRGAKLADLQKMNATPEVASCGFDWVCPSGGQSSIATSLF